MVSKVIVTGTDLEMTRIGLGCGRIRGGRELRSSARILEAALECGIRHFDTAPSYGGGLSEAVLGDVLRGVPDITIATKIGIPRPVDVAADAFGAAAYRKLLRPILSRLPRTKRRLQEIVAGFRSNRRPGPSLTATRKLRRDEVLRGVEESLRHLNRGYLDMFLLHEPDMFVIDDQLRNEFGTLQASGIIRAFGLAFDRAAGVEAAFGNVVQCRYPGENAARQITGETRIFHGLLRRYWPPPAGAAAVLDAGSWFARVLESHPGSALIFSASDPHQVRTIMEQFGRASTRLLRRTST